uniref:Uncharacterized protein n=1 Tax=Ditylenchus dipsaci TaxID=166011 RepID=A0A915ECE6_9BILA
MYIVNTSIFILLCSLVSLGLSEIYGAWPYDPYGPDYYYEMYPYPNPYYNTWVRNRVVAGQITGAQGGAQIGSLVGGILGLVG